MDNFSFPLVAVGRTDYFPQEQDKHLNGTIVRVDDTHMSDATLNAANPSSSVHLFPSKNSTPTATQTATATSEATPPSPKALETARSLDLKLSEIEQALKDEAQLLASKAHRYAELPDEVRDDALIDLSPAPLPAAWLIEGDPCPRIKITTCSPDGGLLSGIWTCRVAKFRFDYPTFDETVHIIRGSADVRIGDEVTKLRAGSIAYFPKGASAEWTVHEPIHKYFVQRNANRGVRKIRSLLNRVTGSTQTGLG